MRRAHHLLSLHSVRAIASGLLWGVLETIALARARWAPRRDSLLPTRQAQR